MKALFRREGSSALPSHQLKAKEELFGNPAVSVEGLAEYLICDGRMPLIALSFYEECLLYGLGEKQRQGVKQDFFALTGKQLREEDQILLLSGGQKVILMVLLALASPAPRILFRALFPSLDSQNKQKIKSLLDRAEDKEIVFDED